MPTGGAGGFWGEYGSADAESSPSAPSKPPQRQQQPQRQPQQQQQQPQPQAAAAAGAAAAQPLGQASKGGGGQGVEGKQKADLKLEAERWPKEAPLSPRNRRGKQVRINLYIFYAALYSIATLCGEQMLGRSPCVSKCRATQSDINC